MNNYELKKKIVDIVNEWHWFQKRDANGNTIWQANDTEKLADALIAAVIDDAKEYKHRAEVAERALKNACEDIISTTDFLCKLEKTGGVVTVKNYANAEAYLKRAEKELAEE